MRSYIIGSLNHISTLLIMFIVSLYNCYSMLVLEWEIHFYQFEPKKLIIEYIRECDTIQDKIYIIRNIGMDGIGDLFNYIRGHWAIYPSWLLHFLSNIFILFSLYINAPPLLLVANMPTTSWIVVRAISHHHVHASPLPAIRCCFTFWFASACYHGPYTSKKYSSLC